MTGAEPLRRGDVVLVDLPFPSAPEREKVRPAVIVQNDVGNRFSPNIIVVAISSQLPSRSYPTNLIVRHGTDLHMGTGLDRDSVVQTETILTLSKRAIMQRIGRFGDAAMKLIDGCLRVSLGLPDR